MSIPCIHFQPNRSQPAVLREPFSTATQGIGRVQATRPLAGSGPCLSPRLDRGQPMTFGAAVRDRSSTARSVAYQRPRRGWRSPTRYSWDADSLVFGHYRRGHFFLADRAKATLSPGKHGCG